ncbi:glycosyltransferase family 4 protein [Chloroflexota bacterium]
MKIALVSPYDFAYPGGVVNHISCLEQHLTAGGHEVYIIAPASKAVTRFGNRFLAVGRPRSIPASGSVARITISPMISREIKPILQREKFDVIHLHEPLMPMLCTNILRHSTQPCVGTFHASGGKPWYNFGSPIAKYFMNKWMDKLDVKIAVSETAKEYIQRFFDEEYTVVPNGIDTTHFNPDVAPMEKYQDNKINILFVGRLEKRKGLDYLLDAYKMIKPEFPDTRLIVVGPGIRLRNKYMKRVAEAGLQDVEFVGYADYDDLPRYYKSADIVCAPATGWESFGIVLLEAMAVSAALVASNIDGYSRVIEQGVDGLLVPPKDGGGMAEALRTLIIDSELRQRLGEAGRKKSVEYDWSKITKKVIDCYTQSINHRK